jgi:uncharacterized membrane protein
VALALTVWWAVAWILGIAVIVVAALLLLVVIGLGRRIVRQAEEITAALEGTRKNTEALFEVRDTNAAVERITRGMRRAREGDPR